MDIPYRERLRDRQARLNLEAERRGKKAGAPGTELGGPDDDDNGHSGDEAAVAKQVREGGDDEYYDLVANRAARKREDKSARHEALAKAAKGERVVEASTVGADGKRQISYQIQKNKGLMPTRRKEVRNPRVKKRMKYVVAVVLVAPVTDDETEAMLTVLRLLPGTRRSKRSSRRSSRCTRAARAGVGTRERRRVSSPGWSRVSSSEGGREYSSMGPHHCYSGVGGGGGGGVGGVGGDVGCCTYGQYMAATKVSKWEVFGTIFWFDS